MKKSQLLSLLFPPILPPTRSASTTTPKPKKLLILPSGTTFGILALVGITGLLIVTTLPNPTEGYNDEKGILKWNPYWFSNFRYSAPSSFYISPSRIGTPYKRLSDSMHSSSSGNYKWSPVFFSGGSNPFQSSSWYGGGGGSSYMYGRPRWTPISSYSGGGGGGAGGSRSMTRYYDDNSNPTIPRSSILDLGSNDLSALLGEEMNTGLDLENDRIDVLDGNPVHQHQGDESDTR